MKDEAPQMRRLVFYTKKYTKPSVYLLFIAAAYALGYFTATTSTQESSPRPPRNRLRIESVSVPEPDLIRFRTRCGDPVPSKLVRQTLLNRLFNGTSPYENFPPSHAAGLLRPTRIKGWGSTGPVFENLLRRVKPRTIVEIGSFLGASAIHMATLARDLSLKTQILCVDDFRGWPGFRDRFRDIKMINGDLVLLHQFMQNVAHMNLSDVVLPLPFSTASALESLCDWGVYADLVEVDAGHGFHSAWADINLAYAILRPRGVIFGHDYFTAADDKGVRRAVNLFARVKGLTVRVDGQHWVIDS